MGAILPPKLIPVLQQHLLNPQRAVRDMCEIAFAKIEWDNNKEDERSRGVTMGFLLKLCFCRPLTSTDTATPSSDLLSGKRTPTGVTNNAFPSLRGTLPNVTLLLFERYRVMFALHDIGSAAMHSRPVSEMSDFFRYALHVPSAAYFLKFLLSDVK